MMQNKFMQKTNVTASKVLFINKDKWHDSVKDMGIGDLSW